MSIHIDWIHCNGRNPALFISSRGYCTWERCSVGHLGPLSTCPGSPPPPAMYHFIPCSFLHLCTSCSLFLKDLSSSSTTPYSISNTSYFLEWSVHILGWGFFFKSSILRHGKVLWKPCKGKIHTRPLKKMENKTNTFRSMVFWLLKFRK